MKKLIISGVALLITAALVLCIGKMYEDEPAAPSTENSMEYAGSPFVTVMDNRPMFTEAMLTTKAYETYADLDSYGRCGVAIACIGPETMPKDGEERESISHVKPSGWVQKEYDFVDNKFLYNRCHLIGWQLTAENANEQNLITGTRYMNTEGMLPFENMVADYIRETGNHVLYRVKPQFYKKELVCRGVEIEALSIEDNGEGISFHVFCFNVQPGVEIDYATGNSWLEGETAPTATQPTAQEYVLNTKSKRIHKPDCGSVNTIAETNRGEFKGDIQELLDQGYKTCGSCFKEK